ncbi:MAG TPA: PD-(D/E)XK nuclease family protein, partial [Ilumatobacteraceae bacterium]|nr:PD-(D/E)XK nuclease family protein [Ilumatobacteraceae bacterium]
MALDRRSTPYGVPALQALRAAIDHVQAGDPLTPVTVLVHSNSVGVAARRWLASHGGIAAAQFVTSFRFAELLGGPALATQRRRPVSTPVVDVAVRAVLDRAPGMFAPIASHQATITALRDAARDLRHVPPAALDTLGRHGSSRAREVVRIAREVWRVLRDDGWYDEADLVRAASEAAAHAPTRTVVFLPQRLRSTEATLLEALGRHGDVVVLDGDDTPPSPTELDIVDVSDADEEAREALRIVAAAVHDGTPLHRIAVLWPRTDPYARLVGEHLDQAGIPWNGRSGIALHERLAARLVLDLFRLDRRGIRRADLFALLAHVPLWLPNHTRAPRQRWERISRDAGLAGDADWNTRLPAYAEGLRARAAADDSGSVTRWLDDAAAADDLATFVADLRARLGAAGTPRTWEHWANVAHSTLRGWLGGFGRIGQLPEVERVAFERVQASLDRLGRLDGFAPPVTRADFADTLAAELDSAPGRAGHIGTGVHIGPISFAVGQEFELVIVLGACEGFMPSPPPPESLLGDADRRLTDGALALDADLATDQQHQWWAALAGAQRAVVLRPRGDLRATAQRQPSRWLGELASGAAMRTRSVPSFAAGLADAAFPVTVGQHRIRSLTHARRAGAALLEHDLITSVEPLRRGAAMVCARLEPRFTEYDGDLSGLQFEPLGPNPISPTKLEAWVACPHAWFMRYVLGIDEVEQPDEQLQITPRDRGTLVHAALDRFHHLVLDNQLSQPDDSGWSEAHREALLDA